MSRDGLKRALVNATPAAGEGEQPDLPGGAPSDVWLVGPNAIIQTRAALLDSCGEGRVRRIFRNAGLEDWFDTPPDRMVPAAKVDRLNSELLSVLDGAAFEAVMLDAGRRTGRYILDNRIPAPARRLLGLLPPGLAARALLKAVKANSWTFAGQADIRIIPGHPAIIEISGNPLPMPGCPWHVAVFQTLFAALLARPVLVGHRLAVAGTRLDRFEVRWRG